MKAIRVNGWGQPLSFEDISQPMPASDEVLVRVHAASVNPFDVFVHAGYLQGMLSVPLTLGTDFSGDVVEVGSEINHVKPGDVVYGLTPLHSGTFAEYVIAKENEVAQKPKSLDYIHAAAVPLSSLAAFQSLFELGQAQRGERVLIIGAGGAVGGCAVQLAKDLGAYVYAVDIPEKADFIRDLNPDRFIDANKENFENVVSKIDLVLDYVGGEYLQRSLGVLRPGGRYITSLVLQTPVKEADQRGVKTLGLGTQARRDQLDDFARRIDASQLKIFVNRTFPLVEAQQAMDYRQKTTQPGKIVLTVR